MNRGAPLDLVFQSVAGSEAANRSFGIDLAVLRESYEAGLALKRGTVGQNIMYFETGQGSALSANAHHGVDQQTMETRAYAVARAFDPLLVNTVVGFIGPEYLYDGKQIIRAGLEDHFCGKLLGLPMGCDVCYTNHAEADQDDMDQLMTLLTVAGATFLIAVPGSDDIMLNYQSLSFHDVLYLRETLGVRAAPEFEAWLDRMGLATPGRGHPRTRGRRSPHVASSVQCEAGGMKKEPFNDVIPNSDPWSRLRAATKARIGLGRSGHAMPLEAVLDFQHAHASARDAVHRPLDVDALSRDLHPHEVIRVRSAAPDRRTYLTRPDLGRTLGDETATGLDAAGRGFDIAFVIGDGLSATAVQMHAAALVKACAERLPGSASPRSSSPPRPASRSATMSAKGSTPASSPC